MPKISVIVPVYNVEKYLHQCVKSILAQTFSDFELILVDDGSPDSSGAICDEYASKDARVRVIHKENGGVSSARNAGLDWVYENSNSEYIAFIDSDDWIEKDYLQQLMYNDTDLMIFGFVCKNYDGKILYEIQFKNVEYKNKSEIDYAFLYENRMLYSPYGKRFKRKIIQNNNLRFPENITWGEDGMFVADYLFFVEDISVSDYIGYNYIHDGNNVSLSTKLRINIIDDVVVSRTYIIEKLASIHHSAYGSVKQSIEKDILFNCKYFIEQVIKCNTNFFYNIKLLNHFLKNNYVKEIKANPKRYFENNKKLQLSMSARTSFGVIFLYKAITLVAKIKYALSNVKRNPHDT